MTYVFMEPTELDACASLAARAFFDYEYFSNYFPNEEKRRYFLNQLLKIEIKI